ncbi:MAG: bifunctional acetate--CoA ligase family protein/GNAT family N-acetyltransferase [Chloroflexi bacterium]|nr:bifunctional acetate--CoA ligase family protein/GNAT family N-acetyltransferase [Chloroflexota bacterium]MCI0577095.1 bifunctional acetate--CoA ligase family protein/GNAT family N-acetyltransferase [Chloroflexota bacterium]MCI0643765.1 bifunctional acetate--CoA ligase family protein/GNAT family N-acetyltransferase [Chloroflexota bacterium]MCI0731581.1 bifunctional acetate--CoA ligase family protein/GNAT family N-acetyltransferase [Chloroflexota bacterium]
MNEPTTKSGATDAAHDVLRYEHQPLDAIFAPSSVAVIGATEKEGSVGRTILWNLITNSFGGTVFPVNPKRSSILGIKAYPSITAVPDQVDLAVVVTPAATVPGVIRDCATAGVKSAIVISAGFKETGPQGVELERQLLAEARRGRMRLIGPNCLGVMNPITGLNATFAHTMARPGKVGFISQSGALCTAILDWSLHENVGFSAFVSIGSMLDVGWGDLITYLGNDSRTESIVMYMETIGDARSFLSAAREVALTKPIIVIKPGQTEAAAKAAASHTGSLTGSDEVLAAAFRRVGVLRVNRISDLFNMAEVLSKQPRPRGNRLTIITNAGGPGVLATDALIGDGGALANISLETMAALNDFLPPHWSHNNPIDILGDAGSERYTQTLEVAAREPGSDGLLVILTPQAMTDPTRTAEELKKVHHNLRNQGGRTPPLLASWMGGAEVAAGEAILNQAGIPTFNYPDTAAHMFNYMWRYAANLRSLYETPQFPTTEEEAADRAQVEQLVNRVRASGRTILTEYESKQLLAIYGIPVVETRLAASADEAVAAAGALGYPVVLKLNSETITHKTDVGGVRLNLAGADEVRAAYQAIQSAVAEEAGAEHFQGVAVQPMVRLGDAYELIVGSSPDAQFGPVLLFGAGGLLVEVFKDRALALPPLNTTLARRMMERTKIYQALLGVRGRDPVDLAALEKLLVQFSFLVAEQRWIKEIDINPLLASSDQLIALDARVVLHDPATNEDDLPRLAIRPYPSRYIQPWTMKDGVQVNIRPIRPEDEPLMVKFHEGLSEQSVYLRYFHALKLSQRVAHERLTRICFIDYDREMVLVTVRRDAEGNREIIGVGRLSKVYGTDEAEFAILISDAYQGQGLGSELLRRLVQIARAEGTIGRIVAYMLPENRGMKKVSENQGFHVRRDGRMLKAELELS